MLQKEILRGMEMVDGVTSNVGNKRAAMPNPGFPSKRVGVFVCW
jgi:hypothetical protein